MRNKPQKAGHSSARPGMTLIELTVVILVLLSLIGLSFVGVTAWKRGVDRSECLINIRNVQLAVRGYANTQEFDEGENVAAATPPVTLEAEIFGPDKMLDNYPLCPANGLYAFGGDIVPEVGTLYMTCSLAASERHEPTDLTGW